ncbi:MAG: hypothetical protein NZZ41_00620 [Candidatus Dojkabacteria bacterium]|nr:hypothetical protein [Candidatus Dojkabacteria bacterium]
MNNKIDYLKLQTETYKAALEESNRTIEELQRFNSLQKREIENLNKRNVEIENQRNQLARQLRNLNLNNNTDPKEIENKINSFINDLFKRLENNSKNK